MSLDLLKNNKPRILLFVDKPNWAFDITSNEYIKYLSNEFIFEKKYVIKHPIMMPFGYDLIHIFFWGEKHYKYFLWKKRKILKEVSSHRWEDDPLYGPCTPAEFAKKYLYDAHAVLCTSENLYRLISPYDPHVYLAHNGYNPALFYFYENKKLRDELSYCWVGNRNDLVKGIDDILIPAAERCCVSIDIASNHKQSDLCLFYNEHDIIVIASKHEGTPLPLIEAMACGCFPVCTNVGNVPELIIHKQNGYIVHERTIEAFVEAFTWCKDNISYIRAAGVENSKLVYEKRRWEVCAEEFRILYRKALN